MPAGRLWPLAPGDNPGSSTRKIFRDRQGDELIHGNAYFPVYFLER
jgi:hypothetical protein